MKVTKISIKNKTTSFGEKITNFFLIPILIFVLIGVLIWMILIFIKEKILGIKSEDKEPENIEIILFENDNFKIIKNIFSIEEIEETEKTEKYKCLVDFYYKIFEYSDEGVFFQLEDKKLTTDLNKCYITNFQLNTNKNIYLQQLVEENEKINSFLIKFNKETGKTETIHEIGDYILVDFDKKKNIIKGFSNNKEINLKIEL